MLHGFRLIGTATRRIASRHRDVITPSSSSSSSSELLTSTATQAYITTRSLSALNALILNKSTADQPLIRSWTLCTQNKRVAKEDEEQFDRLQTEEFIVCPAVCTCRRSNCSLSATRLFCVHAVYDRIIGWSAVDLFGISAAFLLNRFPLFCKELRRSFDILIKVYFISY